MCESRVRSTSRTVICRMTPKVRPKLAKQETKNERDFDAPEPVTCCLGCTNSARLVETLAGLNIPGSTTHSLHLRGKRGLSKRFPQNHPLSLRLP